MCDFFIIIFNFNLTLSTYNDTYTFKGYKMAQVTIYMNNDLESKIKNIANSLGISISKFIANILEQKVQNEWNTTTKQLVGSWDDFPTLEEIRDTKTQNIQREEF